MVHSRHQFIQLNGLLFHHGEDPSQPTNARGVNIVSPSINSDSNNATISHIVPSVALQFAQMNPPQMGSQPMVAHPTLANAMPLANLYGTTENDRIVGTNPTHCKTTKGTKHRKKRR